MRFLAIAALGLILLGGLVRKIVPAHPNVEPEAAAPDQIFDFAVLYHDNCSGCHGSNGRNGPAPPIGNPTYLALADEATMRRVASNGVPGTPMPAFAQSAGGMLTDRQIDALVAGIRSRWANPYAFDGANPPQYSVQAPGDSARGTNVYATYCASCHGANGKGSPKASSIVDGSFLALVSDQGLRTTVIVGRPELGFPDWRNDLSGHPMSNQEISDVVAWMAGQRPRFPGQPYASSKPGESQ
jgi:mono/diheme cytochrome c family protein